jgi:peptide/nickel transport system substrate-binding protein
VVLTKSLMTGGPWNAAHFANKTYDNLVKSYIAAIDLHSQKRIAGRIERLLLDQTPIVIPYYLDGITASTHKIHGLAPTSLAAIFLKDTFIAS